MERLSSKQRILCDNVAQGMTHYEAYASAFSVKDRSKNGIEKSVGEILKKPQCLEYMEELKEKAKSEAIASRADILMAHTQIMRDDELPPIDRQRSMAEISKMQGFYEPEKLEMKKQIDMGAVIMAINRKERDSHE